MGIVVWVDWVFLQRFREALIKFVHLVIGKSAIAVGAASAAIGRCTFIAAKAAPTDACKLIRGSLMKRNSYDQ